MRKLSILSMTALLLTLASPAHAADRVVPDAVFVHPFLETSGQFSPEITSMSDFSSWNFEPRGKGIPDGEKFGAILVRVRPKADKEVFAKGEQARLTVTSLKERKIICNERIADVYIGPKRVGYRAFLIPGIACKSIEIALTGGARPLRKTLQFGCGE